MSETEWTEVPVVEGRETDLETLRAQGRALRETCPTSTQGEWEAKSGRPSPEEYVRATHEERVDDLLALRMARMSATPFAFFRGSAGIMAADLASTPDTGLRAKLCGDAHAGNFGLYGTAEGQARVPGWPFEALTDACRDLAAGGRPRLPRGTEATVRAGWLPEA